MANLCVFNDTYPAPYMMNDPRSEACLPEQMAALRQMMESGEFCGFKFKSALYYCPQIPFKCPFFEAFLEQFPDALNQSLDRVSGVFYCLLKQHFKFISQASWVALIDGHGLQSTRVFPKEILRDKLLLLHAIPRLLYIKVEDLAAFHDDVEVMGAFLRKRPYSACRVFSEFPPAAQTVALAKIAMEVDPTGTFYLFYDGVVPAVSHSVELWGAALESGLNICSLPSACFEDRPTVLKAAGFSWNAKQLFIMAPAFSDDREIVLRALEASPTAFLFIESDPELYAECCAVSPAVYRYGRNFEEDLRLDPGIAVTVFSKDGRQIRHYPTFPLVPPRFLLHAVANTGDAMAVLVGAADFRQQVPRRQVAEEVESSMQNFKTYMRELVFAQAGTVQALVAHQLGGRGVHGRNALNGFPEEVMRHVVGFLGGIKREYKLALVARANMTAFEDEKHAAEARQMALAQASRVDCLERLRKRPRL